MGEATYYCKIFYRSPEEAKAALPKVAAYLSEGSKAHDFWQANRSRKPEDFWPGFEKNFPEVSNYLRWCMIFGGDCNNSLAGMMSFGEEMDVVENLIAEGRVIKYSAEVWHFADWKPLFEFICKRTGGHSFKWLSDEWDRDFFDLLHE